MTVEDSLKLLERYGVTLVILAVIAFSIGVVATILYREWLHWRPRVESWINDWRISNEKTQETYRNATNAGLDLQRSNGHTLQGCALTLKAIHELVLQNGGCLLSAAGDETEIRDLRRKVRAQRKLSESRAQPDPPSQT